MTHLKKRKKVGLIVNTTAFIMLSIGNFLNASGTLPKIICISSLVFFAAGLVILLRKPAEAGQ